MKFNIISVTNGKFDDEKTGKQIAYGSVNTLNEEHQTRDGFSGLEVKKIKCDYELFAHISSQVPAYFECEIDFIGKDNKLKITSAKVIK